MYGLICSGGSRPVSVKNLKEYGQKKPSFAISHDFQFRESAEQGTGQNSFLAASPMINIAPDF
jgi:hypothetical protein